MAGGQSVDGRSAASVAGGGAPRVRSHCRPAGPHRARRPVRSGGHPAPVRVGTHSHCAARRPGSLPGVPARLLGGISRVSPWWRTAGLVAGAVYLEALLPHTFRHEFFGASTVTIAVTTATLLVAQGAGGEAHARGRPRPVSQVETEGLRFSIRSLMLFTAAVAVLSAGARVLRRPGSPSRADRRLGAVLRNNTRVALWATLGNARPRWRAPVVFAIAPVLGAFFAIAVRAHPSGCVLITLTMLLYPSLLLGSLLIVRWCGYRLIAGRIVHTQL